LPARPRESVSGRLAGLVLLAASSGLLAAAPPARAAQKGESPLEHVVLLVSDTMAARHLRPYGYAGAHTAAFDTLAAEGVLFRHCLVPMGWTLASHMSMFTGLDPAVHRVGKYQALPAGIPLLAELLKQHGFRTAGFPTANEWLAARYGFERGFDHYQMLRLETDAVPVVRDWLARHVQLRSPHGSAFPFFLFYHAMDCHSRPHTYPYPYLPVQRAARGLCEQFRNPPAGRFLPPEKDELFGQILNWDLAAYDQNGLRCGYDACIAAWDEFRLRGLLTALRETGHLRDTLVIITADHGEELGQHGGWYHDSPYGEVREVPLLMLWPGHLPAGAVVERYVSLLDITPTVLDLAGLPPPEPCQGRSLKPLLADPTAPFPDRDFLVDGLRRGWRLLPAALVAPARGGWWSLVAQMDTTGTSGTSRPPRVAQVLGLYDLDRDPGETRDRRLAEPELVQDLRTRLEARFAADAELAAVLAGAETQVELSDEQERQLRSLGY